MAIKIQLRRDTGANWNTFNPVLVEGEIGIETDTRRFKIGDGVTPWTGLVYGGLTANATNTEVIQVTPQILADKKVQLAYVPSPSNKTKVQIQGAPTQIVNIDFMVVGNEVRWDSLALEQLIDLNDYLIIDYYI